MKEETERRKLRTRMKEENWKKKPKEERKGRMSRLQKKWWFALTPDRRFVLVDWLVKDFFTTNKNTLLKDACIDQHEK